MIRRNSKKWVFFIVLLGVMRPLIAEPNMRLYGALVAEPCVIRPGDEEIHLDFGSIIDKYLYLNQRTAGQRFEIHLEECDLSLANTVRIRFVGMENRFLKGLLAIDGRSQATGIAIGLETADAAPLPLNTERGSYRLLQGSNVIALNAYVQGEPEAIAKEAIEHGPFSAAATFRLEYE